MHVCDAVIPACCQVSQDEPVTKYSSTLAFAIHSTSILDLESAATVHNNYAKQLRYSLLVVSYHKVVFSDTTPLRTCSVLSNPIESTDHIPSIAALLAGWLTTK